MDAANTGEQGCYRHWPYKVKHKVRWDNALAIDSGPCPWPRYGPPVSVSQQKLFDAPWGVLRCAKHSLPALDSVDQYDCHRKEQSAVTLRCRPHNDTREPV